MLNRPNIGDILLVKPTDGKVVPALCIKAEHDGLTLLQIRTYTERDKQEEDSKQEQLKRKKKFQMDWSRKLTPQNSNYLYIGKPKGLKAESVVLLRRFLHIKQNQIIKKLAQVSDDLARDCLNQAEKLRHSSEYHLELHRIKKQIELAKFNNERYEHLENRLGEILQFLGYEQKVSTNEKAFLNYREVPTEGYIKVYHGGR
jgi:hypothetical protein